MNGIKKSIYKVLSNMPYAVIFGITTLLVLVIYYAVLISSTPWEIFIQSNNDVFIFLQIFLSIINALLIGLVIAMVVLVLEKRRKSSNLTIIQALASLLFSVAATGCTVCGAVLLPTLGIAASLSALPFAGLEIKTLTIFLLIYSTYEYSRLLDDNCDVKVIPPINIKRNKEGYYISFNKGWVSYFKPVGVVVIFFGILTLLPILPKSWKVNFSRKQNIVSSIQINNSHDGENLINQVTPASGVDLNIKFGSIGPAMIKAGVIDVDAFKKVYENGGQPLSSEQIDILTKGSNKNIVINRDNAYFLLNFFWAFGLANQNPILTEGQITKYGDGQIAGFASTGGWSLASKDLVDYFSKTKIVALTPSQQRLVEEVSSNIYRPCCGNSTAFPDCNHGMALLGILEVLAAGGANEQEMYDASKYVNAYWFPSTYNDLAMYFKSTENKVFADIDSKKLLGKEYSSAQGYQNKKNKMRQDGILPEPAQTSGGGCGV